MTTYSTTSSDPQMTIQKLLAKLLSEKNLKNIIIYFEKGYEIHFDDNNTPYLWEYGEYCCMYHCLYTDLIEFKGIIHRHRLMKLVHWTE